MTKRLTKDERIRKLAHDIWESEGRPDGDHERHWHQARRELEVIESMKTSTARSGGAKAKNLSKAKASVKPDGLGRADLSLVTIN